MNRFNQIKRIFSFFFCDTKHPNIFILNETIQKKKKTKIVELITPAYEMNSVHDHND